MNLQVKITKEHEDGSADALVTVDKEAWNCSFNGA
jgi:hypothetical protein